MNKRNLVLDKYGISGKRYKELSGFCEQYPEWKSELKHKKDTVKCVEITDMPITRTGNSDQTGKLAIRRAELKEKCDLIEGTATQASQDLANYIIKSVCYEVPFGYLESIDEIPCSRATFYDARRYFFYLLDKNKKM